MVLHLLTPHKADCSTIIAKQKAKEFWAFNRTVPYVPQQQQQEASDDESCRTYVARTVRPGGRSGKNAMVAFGYGAH
jgi:hypothetical protein